MQSLREPLGVAGGVICVSEQQLEASTKSESFAYVALRVFCIVNGATCKLTRVPSLFRIAVAAGHLIHTA